ncbi:formylglycine-generating enzyme required for sulfatase activity [Nocardia puris]|uniref:Formylglycine-generating enzyme required for sulfatase activity n=2 Tax=Nocardia puris TaxID=208602 RepID=A0A366D5A5_9NOCA|nr:formylglycine-generating enzyme required for sulfatase activity [Nocardia puris]
MSIRDFAAHLGVHERLISKWEAGGAAIEPRQPNQAALDTSLSNLNNGELARFLDAVPNDRIRTTTESGSDSVNIALPQYIRHPIDGKLVVWIPAGVFLAGVQNEPEYLPGFHCDVYPTTNGDYSRFVAATGHTPPQHWNGDRPPKELTNHPVVWVSHDDATAYAEWAHKTLPTSLQWEKAARGSTGARWPWGDASTPAKANTRGVGPGTTTPVDRYASGYSPYGVADCCGNVWEWQASPSPVGPGRYELKGSAFTSPFDRTPPAAFNDADHAMRDDDTGFRCVTTTLTDPVDTPAAAYRPPRSS